MSIIKQAKENCVSEKCIRTTENIKNLIAKKEVDAKVEAFEKQLRSKYIKLMN